jgi:hypothetical protein
MKNFIKKYALESGQALSEYVPILGGASVVVLLSVAILGRGMEGMYQGIDCAVENRDGFTECDPVEVADSDVPEDTEDFLETPDEEESVEEEVACEDVLVALGEDSNILVSLGDSNSYLDIVVDDNGTSYDAWCVDRYHTIKPGESYPTDIHSTLEGGVPVNNPGNMDVVNWLLNQDFTSNGYTALQVQEAIWGLVETNYTPSSQVSKDLVTLAKAEGEGFTPGNGEIFGVVFEPTDNNNSQHVMLEFVLDCAE